MHETRPAPRSREEGRDPQAVRKLTEALAEVFQATRTISLSIDTPAWAVFALTAEITPLDLADRKIDRVVRKAAGSIGYRVVP